MNLRMDGGMVEFRSLVRSLVWLIVSKALLRSMAMATVRSGGRFWLKPETI